MTGYGTRHREYRKLLSEALTARKTQEYYPMQEEATRESLVDLLESPDKILHHIRRQVVSVPMLYRAVAASVQDNACS